MCGPAKYRCVTLVGSQLFKTKDFHKCKCLASCVSLNYDIEESLNPYDFITSASKSKDAYLYELEKYRENFIFFPEKLDCHGDFITFQVQI